MQAISKKVFASALALALSSSLMLVGCSQPSKEPAQQAPQASEQASESKTQEAPKTETAEQKSLFIYCGAGMKGAMEEIKAGFEKSHPGTTLDVTYDGSGKLLAQLQASQKGDVFIVGAKNDYENAKKEGLVQENVPVSNHTPAIVVQKGNPKNIKGLEDLAKDGVSVVLADPDSASIGKTAQKIFEKNNLQKINDNVKAHVGTVKEIVAAIQAGNADAGICTKDSVFDAKDVELVTIPNDQNVNQIITASITTFTEDQELAEEFMKYLKSDEGKKAYKNHGFLPVE